MRRLLTITLTYLAITASPGIHAAVDVYPGASEALRSARYHVAVVQGGETQEAFVYADENRLQRQRRIMTDWNHWTSFAMEGEVEIRIRVPGGQAGACTVYPLRHGIKPVRKGDVFSFKLAKPAQLYVAFEGMDEDPLFIFANPPETDVPNPDDPDVVWFGPGIHEIGERYEMKRGKTYYLAPGAYVKGSFYGMELSNTAVRGRGILSGEDIPHMGYKDHEFKGVAIHFDGNGTNQLVEGITIINPSMYCIQSYCGRLATRNVKCFGWHYQTDGWVGGSGSVLEDSFFKVNDDVVKLYTTNNLVRGLVIYHQCNGAPFQFGWSSESGCGSVVENIDIVKSEPVNSNVFNSNKTLINLRRGNAASQVKDMLFRDIRVDQDCSGIIGLSTKGRVSDIEIRNLTVRGNLRFPSYLEGNVSGIHFVNVAANGKRVYKAADIDLQTRGSVSDVTFNP